MLKGGGVKATKVSDKTVSIDKKQSAGIGKRYGKSVEKAINKAGANGKPLNKTALVALLTVKGSKLNPKQALSEANKIIGNAKDNKMNIANPMKGRKLVDMEKVYNLPKGKPTDGMTEKQVNERADRILKNAKAMLGKKTSAMMSDTDQKKFNEGYAKGKAQALKENEAKMTPFEKLARDKRENEKFDRLTADMNSKEADISKMNKEIDKAGGIDKVSKATQEKYNNTLASWDKMKVERDAIKADRFARQKTSSEKMPVANENNSAPKLPGLSKKEQMKFDVLTNMMITAQTPTQKAVLQKEMDKLEAKSKKKDNNSESSLKAAQEFAKKQDSDRANLRKASDAEIDYIVAQGKKEGGKVPATGTLEKRSNLRMETTNQIEELKQIVPSDKEVMTLGFEMKGDVAKIGKLANSILNNSLEIGQMSKETMDLLKQAAPFNRGGENKTATSYVTVTGTGSENEVKLSSMTEGKRAKAETRLDVIKNSSGEYELV